MCWDSVISESPIYKEKLRLKNEMLKPCEIHMTEEQASRFWDYIYSDDLDFYEDFLIYLPNNQQEIFFEENPEFMSEFPVSRDKMYLLKNKTFRDTLRKIKRYEGGK